MLFLVGTGSSANYSILLFLYIHLDSFLLMMGFSYFFFPYSRWPDSWEAGMVKSRMAEPYRDEFKVISDGFALAVLVIKSNIYIILFSFHPC